MTPRVTSLWGRGSFSYLSHHISFAVSLLLTVVNCLNSALHVELIVMTTLGLGARALPRRRASLERRGVRAARLVV